jgi:ABC-type antimicrobial peptide transport system permease subunit
MLSFNVVRRTREIGLRVALGASPVRIVTELLRAPVRLVAMGVAVGCVPIAGFILSRVGTVTPIGVAFFLAFALAMVTVCALAALVPGARALRIQPTEALKEGN